MFTSDKVAEFRVASFENSLSNGIYAEILMRSPIQILGSEVGRSAQSVCFPPMSGVVPVSRTFFRSFLLEGG
jgi:hypothetical protein